MRGLARRFVGGLLDQPASDAARASLVASALGLCARQLGREVPRGLTLGALAAESPTPVPAPAELWPFLLQQGGPPLGADAPPPGFSGEVLRRAAYAHGLGHLLDLLHAVDAVGARSGDSAVRRYLGSYFTPRSVATALAGKSFSVARCSARSVKVCDPAMGGGAFLVEAALLLARGRGARRELDVAALREVAPQLYGFDVDPLAVATAEAALWLLTDESEGWAQRLRIADALTVCVEERFDWIIGNPPWVAYQGRATQKISPERRAYLRRRFRAFQGFPTLHGIFVERATELAPEGVIALLLPSSVSDLAGYRATRASLARSHRPLEPLPEYGEDAFPGVVQPCFGLVALPLGDSSAGLPGGDRSGEGRVLGVDAKILGPGDSRGEAAALGVVDAPEPHALERKATGEEADSFPAGRPWVLEERSTAAASAPALKAPACLQELAGAPCLPPTCFGELGFQSNRVVSQALLLRAEQARAPFLLPLLEGKNVSPFGIGAARLFLDARQDALEVAGCRLRPAADYQRVDFVVRQTAAYPIAARHNGLGFRNSLLGGFATPELDVDLLVGLLNSRLLRALHVSRQRDARQATFPQVKIAHLRGLPAPPKHPTLQRRVSELSRQASQMGLTAPLREQLDGAVFALFAIAPSAQLEITEFLRQRSPRALVF